MVESDYAQKATRELIKLAALVIVTVIMLFCGIGFVLTKSHGSMLPGITRFFAEITKPALWSSRFLTISLTVFLLILIFLIENFLVRNHRITFKVYRGFNIFLIVLVVLLTWSVVVPLIKQ